MPSFSLRLRLLLKAADDLKELSYYYVFALELCFIGALHILSTGFLFFLKKDD